MSAMTTVQPTSLAVPSDLERLSSGETPVSSESSRPNDPQGQTPVHSVESKQKEEKTQTIASWWWWWEIAALIINMTSIILVVIILSKYQNIALSAWPLPIKPNSLIAAITTIGKAAMLIPVTSCISQLKWRHFSAPRPCPLHYLQLMDDASRGPWGSAMLLINTKTRAWLVALLATVMVAAVGIETTAQQILEYPTRDGEITQINSSQGHPELLVAASYSLAMDKPCSLHPVAGCEFLEYPVHTLPSEANL